LEKPFGGILKSFTKPMAMAQQAHTYTELQQQIRDELWFQHPEWIQPNGESPMCDFYEARLVQLLADLPDVGATRARTASAIRNLFEIAAERERKAREVRVARRVWRFCAG
jgi:hypothetical protein